MNNSAYFQAIDPRSAITVSSGQPPNACDPIFVTDEGIVILSREPQRANAFSPIFVTEEGMVKDLTFLGQDNSIVPSLEYLAPSFVFCCVIDRSPPQANCSSGSRTGRSFFSAYFQAVDPRSAIRVSSGQRPNACDPIFVTDEGIVILDRATQPENAPYPISVTEEGIVNEVLPPGQMTRTFRSFE